MISFSNKKRAKEFFCSIDGAPDTTRTCNTWFRRPMLYPLSYRGKIIVLVEVTGVEPASEDDPM